MIRMLQSTIAWMNHSQVILLQTCLNYSAKTHYIHQSCKSAYVKWKAHLSSARAKKTNSPQENQASLGELEMRARRLSLQERRCTVNLQRRKEDTRYSLGGKPFLQSREEMLQTPPPAASPKMMVSLDSPTIAVPQEHCIIGSPAATVA